MFDPANARKCKCMLCVGERYSQTSGWTGVKIIHTNTVVILLSPIQHVHAADPLVSPR